MQINHKFLTVNQLKWNNQFYTENGILKNNGLYRPEILFLGTYNPEIRTNLADFFYGRNYFWPALKNIFSENPIYLVGERLAYDPHNPSLNEIFQICRQLKLTFTDLVGSIFENQDNNHLIVIANKEYVEYNDIIYNPISDGDLSILNGIQKVNWNTQNIITYLRENTQIGKIYFTRRNNACWQTQISLIMEAIPEIQVIPIYTPSAQGGALHQQTGIYGQGKMVPLLRHWTHINNVNFGNLNHNDWLTNNGVNVDNF